MTTSKTTQLERIGQLPINPLDYISVDTNHGRITVPRNFDESNKISLENIDCYPVWDEEEIVLYDMYTKDGVWLGSKRLFRYVKEFNNAYV